MPELLEDVLDVGPDRVLADEQVAADPGVVPAPAEQGEHLALVRRQARQRRVRSRRTPNAVSRSTTIDAGRRSLKGRSRPVGAPEAISPPDIPRALMQPYHP
jgi:hypothetical protein